MAVHKELITSGKFDEKFKRALLDYYSYGFKNLGSFDAKKRQTLSEDWMRLNRVLTDYLEWSDNPGEIMFASADSQTMEENPFHRVYRFCKYKPVTYPAYFLHTMAALSRDISLRGGVDSLGLDEGRRMHIEDLVAGHGRFKTSDLICFYTRELAAAGGDDRNKTPNNRLDDLAQIGLVRCEQGDGERGGKGDRHWSLPGLTLKKVLEAGGHIDVGFERHLRSALDFFSKYYLFGEVGTYLLDRMGDETISPFRFKHEYFMQSLNDFNLIDLLHAIENGKWCRIKYTHGTAGFKTELLCYPLEIRVSNMRGREYLMYYEPFRRSYTALRLEFIDAVEYYGGKEIKSVLSQTGYHPSSESIDSDIANIRQSLKYSWGVSTTGITDGNAVSVARPRSVSMQIAYDRESEYYIADRLTRECRSGIVPEPDDDPYLRFSVGVSDETELRPWLRSFYSRIISCDGMDSDRFSLESDVGKILDSLQEDLPIPPRMYGQQAQPSWWSIPDPVKEKLENGVKAREHDLLFNEAFGIYYYIIADVFTSLSSSGGDVSYSEPEIDRIIRESFSRYYLKIGQETEALLPDEIKELLFSCGFMEERTKTVSKGGSGGFFRQSGEKVKSYVSRYQCSPDLKLYKDVVPLSLFELRWMRTILDDAKLQLFLSKDEIKELRRLFQEYAPYTKPLPMDKIVFFDRFHFSEKNMDREAAVLTTLLNGIYDQKTIRVKYHTACGKVKTGEFKPIIIEFSKRNNRFQGFFQECGSDRICAMDLSGIETVKESDTSFDHAATEMALMDFREDNMTSVEVEFYNVKNTVDRLLTEFSPWKKRCLYDAEADRYKLTVFYQEQDEADLVVRLLGYGADLHYVDREHAICREVRSRVERQMELIRRRRRDNAATGRDDTR